MTDIAALYADTQKPNWAGGAYEPAILEETRSFDCQILSKRSGKQDLEITLPRELAGKYAPDRALPVLINGNTDPMKQVAGVFCNGADIGLLRFSRSTRGQEWQKSFIAGEAQMKLAYQTRGERKSPVAFSIMAVSDGITKEPTMSE